MLDTELSDLAPLHQSKKTHIGHNWWGGEKNGIGFCLREGKKPKGSCSSSDKNKWEPGESLTLVSTAEEAGGLRVLLIGKMFLQTM